MFVLSALHSFAAQLGVTKEGFKGVQRPKKQTLLTLLSREDVK